MKKAVYLTKFVFIVLILSYSAIFTFSENTNENDYFFSINLLSLNYSCCPNVYAHQMEEELPKIGINISYHESTSWGGITPRTWGYPVGEEGKFDYIPTYEDGGYDIFFVGWYWGLDWDPTDLFDSVSIVPNGDNVYQYSNPKFDRTLGEYTTELNDEIRIEKAKELQAILYEDLPAITMLYFVEIYGCNKNVKGIDPTLLINSAHRSENWEKINGENISWAIPAELTEYSIFIQESYYDKLWMNCVYYGLFERSQETHLMEPVIAKNYTVSEDKKVIRVDINPNAYFSNSDKVTAYDVDYTYELFMTKALNTPYYKELTSLFENNDSIKAIDDDTVEFKFKKPYAFALSVLSHGIINKKLVSKYIEENGYKLTVLDQALVTSTGPYMLNVSEFNISKSIITLRPNPYWSITENNPVNKIIFQYISGKDTAISALANGTIDIVDSSYSAKETDYKNVEANILKAKSITTEEMAINMKHPIIGTGELTPLGTAEAAKKIRKAISHAVPRETLTEKIFYGTAIPGVTPMPEGCVGFDSSLEPYSYDQNLAIQLIEETGFTRNTTTDTTGNARLLVITLISICYAVILKRKKK